MIKQQVEGARVDALDSSGPSLKQPVPEHCKDECLHETFQMLL